MRVLAKHLGVGILSAIALGSAIRVLSSDLGGSTPGAATIIDPNLPKEKIELRATKGLSKASVGIIEFSDFQCPFCGKYSRETFPLIERNFVDTGKVRYVFRNLPLTIHPFARKAALIAQCSNEQGRFWETHDWLFAKQQLFGDPSLVERLSLTGINKSQLQRCMSAETFSDVLKKDLADAQRLGITSTPTFLLGVIDMEGRIDLRLRIGGSLPYATFKAALNTLLSEKP